MTGKCFVIAFSRSHNLTLADLQPPDILSIIETWTSLYAAHLSPATPLARVTGATSQQREDTGGHAETLNRQYRYMQIFENKGAAMGCSNPHPHGQVWMTTGLPEEPSLELDQLQRYRRENCGAHLLEDYARLEEEQRERVVFGNEAFLALCPWWGIWPFEVLIVSRKHRRALVDLDGREKRELAQAIAEVTRRYDNLFETRFPYSELSNGRHTSTTPLTCSRHGPAPGATGRNRARNRSKSFPHSFLPTAAT